MHLVAQILFVLFVSESSSASKILFVATTPSYSHQVVYQPIWRELSLRGHQVTVITPNPLKDPTLTNLTELSMEFMYSLVETKFKFSETLTQMLDRPLQFLKFFGRALSEANEDQLSDPQVQRLLNDPNAHFDLVIFEYLLPTMAAFSHRFNCPAIAIMSLDASLSGYDIMGNPTHPVLNPDAPLRFNVPLTFTQRVFSVVYSILRRINFEIIKAEEDQVIAKYFGEDYPPLSELLRNVDMFFVNANLGFHNIRPTVPAVVHIGGSMNIKPPKQLPNDLQEFLDGGKEGVIYFSLGSNIRTKFLLENFLAEMIQAFSMLPYRVLLKIDETELPGLPENIKIVNWAPQQDVLRHANVKAFVTQGGLQSLEETINMKKPVVCIPYCLDHFSNCIQAQSKGMGLAVDYNKVNANMIKLVIAEVAENPKYLEAVEKLADIANDQPMTGLEKAVWWTEYVLRHKGAKHLRSGAADLPLYQYFLLDVLGFLSAVFLVIAWVVVRINKFIFGSICRRFFCKKAEEEKRKKIKKN